MLEKVDISLGSFLFDRFTDFLTETQETLKIILKQSVYLSFNQSRGLH